MVGGDADEPGDFPDGLSLLRAIAELGHPFTEVGIPGYPEGHPTIPDDRLLAALAEKQPFATRSPPSCASTPGRSARWLLARRAAGITLPVTLGIPGVAELHKLIEISARIGVRDSRRFVSKNTALVGRILRPGGYRPDGLLAALVPSCSTRSPTSEASTCTRSTRSRRPRSGARPTSPGSPPSDAAVAS